MTFRSMMCGVTLALLCCVQVGEAAPPDRPATCKRAVIEGELHAGEAFSQPIGGGLKVFFQPIASGWILRVVPLTGPMGEHDYAELATPPYQSVTPLSISTDFAFRAQDAVGWNPRRFRFATSAANFHKLEQMYTRLIAAGTAPQPALESELAGAIAQTSEGTLTIVDSKLVPGTADQWAAAAAVASHFSTTAHTLVQEPDGHTSPLGRLVWLRFRLELDVPNGFVTNSALRVEPGACESRQ
jgi:hypothetical protein